jgi:type I restriction enzyme S subunit
MLLHLSCEATLTISGMFDRWQETTLGAEIQLVKGVTYASADYTSAALGFPFLTIKCVQKGGGFSTEGLKYFRGGYQPEQTLSAGDLLIALTDLTRAGDIVGSPVTVPDFNGAIALPSMDLAILRRTSSNVDLRFLYYRLMLHDARRFMLAHAAGTTVLHLESKAVPKFPFTAPDLKTQQHIAKILSTIDEAIEQAGALIAKTEQIKAGLMHDLFTRGLTSDGQLRPSCDEAPQLYKESPLGSVPKKWDCSPLGELIGHIDSGWSPNCAAEPADYGDWAVLKTTAVVWDGYCPSENKKLLADSTPIESIEVRRGDILITRKGPVDRVGVAVHVADTPPALMFPDTVFRTRIVDHRRVASDFMALAMGSPRVQRYWWQRKVGLADAQVNLNHGILRATPIALPSMREQQFICERIGAVTETRQMLAAELQKLEKLRTGLMHSLLSGRVHASTITGSSAPRAA